MNRKKILIPRYRVLINYPGGTNELNSIIHCENIEEGQYYNQFPDIFQSLQWWENKTFEEMPPYIGYGKEIISKDNYITNINSDSLDGMFNHGMYTEPLWEEDIENFKLNPLMDNEIINQTLVEAKKEYFNALAKYKNICQQSEQYRNILWEKADIFNQLLIVFSNITIRQIEVLQKCCELTNDYLLNDSDLIKMKELNYITEYAEQYHIITQSGLNKLIELNSFYNRHDKEIETKKLRRKISKL